MPGLRDKNPVKTNIPVNKLRVHQKAAIMSLTSQSWTDRTKKLPQIFTKCSQHYRNIFALISPLETADVCEIVDWIIAKFSQNVPLIIALIFPLETADFCEIVDRIIAKFSQNFRKIIAPISPLETADVWNFRRNYRTSALYKLLDRSLKTSDS